MRYNAEKLIFCCVFLQMKGSLLLEKEEASLIFYPRAGRMKETDQSLTKKDERTN